MKKATDDIFVFRVYFSENEYNFIFYEGYNKDGAAALAEANYFRKVVKVEDATAEDMEMLKKLMSPYVKW